MIRTLKYRKQKKVERFEKQQFKKLFDNSQGKVYDKFRDILSEDRDNDQPLYKTRPRQARHGEITREEVEKFWRPIWEDMKEVKLDADWINTVTIVRQSPKSKVLNRNYYTQSRNLKTCFEIVLITC